MSTDNSYYRKNRDERIEYQKLYYVKNKERIREYSSKYYEQHKKELQKKRKLNYERKKANICHFKARNPKDYQNMPVKSLPFVKRTKKKPPKHIFVVSFD